MKKAFKTLAAAFLPTILTVTAFNAHVLANTDDISGHWAETQIKEWANIGYISGYPDGTFLPDNSITRAEFLTLVNKIFKFENKININFIDVRPDYWAYSEIQKGISAGYVSGDKNGTFRPDDFITRQEAAVNINFIDVRPDYWAYSEIQKGISAGYVSGDKNGTFRPDDFITRQEAAVIINKLLDNTEITENKPNFKDAYDIDEWAKNSVDIVYEYGILSGFPNGTYRPKKYMTRAEAVSALKRLTEIKGTEDIGKNEYILREEQMKDKIIDGDLIITDDMDTVNLEGVTVKGNVYVKGGNVIHAENCNINKLITDGEDFTFEADENTTVDKTELNSCGKISGEGFDEVIIDDVCNDEIIIDGDIKNVVHNAKTDIFIGKNADIENFKVTENAESSHIKFEKGSKVKNAEIYGRIKIVGEGEIGTMEVYTSGVESSIRPDDVTTAEGAEDPHYKNAEIYGRIKIVGEGEIGTMEVYTSGVESSIRPDDVTTAEGAEDPHYIELRPILKGEDFNKENLTLDKDFDGKGKNYKNVTITDNAAVSDINASGDVIIENCDVVLKDVSVEGDVVVCGNGSVELEDCLLKKDIVSDINASGDVIIENCDVVLKDVSVEGDVVVCGNGSVELEDCLLKKDIVTVKDDDFKKIVFDNKTKLYGKLIIEGNTEISSECDITVDEVDINSDAVINVNVDKMNVLSDSLIELHDGKTIDYVDIFDGVGAVEFNMNGFSSFIEDIASEKTKIKFSGMGQVDDGKTIDYVDIFDGVGAVEFNMNGFSSFIEDIASEKTKIKFSGMGQVGTVKTDNADNITTDSGITIDDIISDFVPVSNVILAPSEGKKGEVLELNINVEPKNASNKNAIYKIVDDGGTDAKINGNKLVADKSGVIKIKVEIEDGIGIGIPYIKDCIVEIKDNIIPVSDIIMENEDWVYAGEELELKAHVEPEDATYNEIEWSVLEGYAYIEGNIFMHDFTDDWVYAGEELELKAHVEPEDATYNEIEWSVLEGYAYIEGNIFMHDFTDSETVVRILAEVENGAADGVTFSREFEITVIPPKYGFR